MQKKNLSWHIVSNRYEIEELVRYGHIKPWEPRDSRHRLFHIMKYPNQEFYQGNWGPEIMYYDKLDDIVMGQCGRIYCTEQRAEIINAYIRDLMFNVAPGND